MRNISHAVLLRDTQEFRSLLIELGRRRTLRDPIGCAFAEMPFTPAQVHSLLWLGTDGPLTMGEIAARLGITEKTVTGVVDRLEAEGFVVRERSEEDRRVVRVHLTRKGTSIHRRFSSALQEKMSGFLNLLEPEERRTLIRIMKKVVERLPTTDAKRLLHAL